MNADRIVPRLWQGSAPKGRIPFDVIVLTAEEYQPPSHCFGQSEVVRAPNQDTESLSLGQIRGAVRAAKTVADRWKHGKRIVVTCRQGRNRSGLVVALALHLIYGVDGKTAAQIVRERRRGADALTNEAFVGFLERVPGRR